MICVKIYFYFFYVFIVQPFESVPLTITWTPLEEGGVRELVTFLVNDVVKHQAVLLGNAELPSKKKVSMTRCLITLFLSSHFFTFF